MDNFKIIYKILKVLERAMDYEIFDVDEISHEKLKISEQRWEKIIILLAKEGYIEGITYSQTISDYSPRITKSIKPIITLKGLEYLHENSLMKKTAQLVEGVSKLIP